MAGGTSTGAGISRRALGGAAGAIGIGVVVGGCTPLPPRATDPPSPQAAAATSLARVNVQELVEAVPKRSVAPIVMNRLAEGLTPPTNRWFSGLVFGEMPQPVFPLPLGFALVDGGFEMWLPEVVVSDKAIIGQRTAGLTLKLEGVEGALVTAYDVASVTVELTGSEGKGLVAVRLAQGSPTVAVTAVEDAVALTSQVDHRRVGEVWQAEVDGTVFGLVGADVSEALIRIEAGATAVWFVAPPGADVASIAGRIEPVSGTTVSWEVADDAVTTTLGYGAMTLLSTMPHHEAGLVDGGEVLGEYASVFGPLLLRQADAITWRSRGRPIEASLDVSGVDEEDRRLLADLAATDAAADEPYPVDTYFGGKALYRDSQLAAIGRQVGVDVTQLTARATEALVAWAEPEGAASRGSQCFVYDERIRGMVGLEPSFGSDEFNDHHFHYGYLLHAAGTLCAQDSGLAARLAPVFDLIAADIASPVDDGLFPQLRCFDVYASHSWASGTAPFADGNNQESSSEAVHAWAGLALWARARGDTVLERQAIWMHALEADAALVYWLQPDPAAFEAYRHRVVGIGWGAKRDYATWFSADPMAILMIQIIPAGPSSGYLAEEPARIAAAVAEAVGTGGFGRQYGDYCLMYQAGADRDGALAAADQVAAIIDNAVTLTYVTAYLLTR